MKAIKNSTEIEGFRQCHIRDGVALARYFAWLEEQLHNGVVLNESQGSDKLEEFRSCVMSFTLHSSILTFDSELDLFRGLSFTTISSAGPNAGLFSCTCRGAILTYFSYHSLLPGPRQLCDYHKGPGTHVAQSSSFYIDLIINKIYLCDSGGMRNQKNV
jgi:hypothetical protein